jgi:regulator of RNase E activity RraA
MSSVARSVRTSRDLREYAGVGVFPIGDYLIGDRDGCVDVVVRSATAPDSTGNARYNEYQDQCFLKHP